MTTTVEPHIEAFVREAGLLGTGCLSLEPLTGGVSSDIWLVEDGTGAVVVKTPLADLRVASGWTAPLSRGASEAGWLRVVGDLVPGACPKVLAHDPDRHLLALEYLPPSQHHLWKADLLEGKVDLMDAGEVGARLGLIHQSTARLRGRLSAEFGNEDLFAALRIEPYLEHLLVAHPQLAEPVRRLIDSLHENRVALVHGDASPKNILLGPSGPVFIDAEAAWWGDPAFDVAFCVNHLLLKCLLPGTSARSLIDAAILLVARHRTSVTWEDGADVDARVAALLPALLLARVDGRSPVEYLDAAQQEVVRAFAVPLVLDPPADTATLFELWRSTL